jgi:hypothetical protein
MKQDQIIQMMKKVVAENQNYTTWTVSTPHLVALVNHAIEVEREACAKLCEQSFGVIGSTIALAIKARGEQA